MLKYYLWYSRCLVSNKEKLYILDQFDNLENIYRHIFIKRQKDIFLTSNQYNLLKAAWNIDELTYLENRLLAEGVSAICFSDEKYPKNLKNIANPPCILFFKGKIENLNFSKSVAIVGSRNCSFYGKNVTELISECLALSNINIISGLAKGIDGIAHETVLKNAGYTCGVLGCGIDIIYPKQNKNLYKLIENQGCILTEFYPGTPPISQNFPIRNRIISGLSDLIIVIEGTIKSGSLITASFALDQGKDVMAVPGSIFSSKSKGTNKLIKDGAYVFTDLEDIEEILNLKLTNSGISDTVPNKATPEGKIYKLINDSPIHIDDIARLTNIDINQLYELLFEMQVNNKIMCLSGNYFVKINHKIN